MTSEVAEKQQHEQDSWVLKFVPFASTVESSFWVRYCQEKLDTIRLSQEAIDVSANYTTGGSSRLQLPETSLTTTDSSQFVNKNELVYASGALLGYNTVEAFQTCDKNALLQDWFTPRFQQSKDDPALLNSFLLLTYADLKNHKVLYWFAIPALMPVNKKPICATGQDFLSNVSSLEESNELALQVDKMRMNLFSTGHGCTPFFIYTKDQCLPLNPETYQQVQSERVVFGFFDPSFSDTATTQAKSLPLGWPMRNLVAYLSIHLDLGGQAVEIVSYRPQRLRRIYADMAQSDTVDNIDNKSLLITAMVPPKEDYMLVKEDVQDPQYRVVGWELNARSKPGPRWVNLRPLLDETHLAIQAADLNLKLMKWRMIPSLNVDLLQQQKVLVLGAGTLGCSVARVLLGWGIRHFKFVDYGKVSYSNPVRQNLFTLEDCKADGAEQGTKTTGTGGRTKAVAAATALHDIAANVKSEGIVVSIPMPGHVESDQDSLKSAVNDLDAMVQECDVVFLLTDTRESRWLPTVMAAAHEKPLINAALGLDSWLVMRHGGGPSSQDRLGCYFCNDVVAPENSMKNRTLDQQCTVTRPGLAPIASSMAVELLIALLHHPQGHGALAPSSGNKGSLVFSPTVSSSESPLGIIPHQIRGSLVSYTMMTPTVPAFAHCTACSTPIVEAYQEDKMALVQGACESRDGSFLEEKSGLTAFRAEAASKMVDMEDWEDDE